MRNSKELKCPSDGEQMIKKAELDAENCSEGCCTSYRTIWQCPKCKNIEVE